MSSGRMRLFQALTASVSPRRARTASSSIFSDDLGRRRSPGAERARVADEDDVDLAFRGGRPPP